MLSKLKQLFARLKQSKDGKTLVANFGYLSLLQVAGYVFPLITMPYLARVIGAEGFGKIAFAAAIMVWFQTIADWGFCYTATRDVAKNRDDREKVSEIFSNVFWARILLMFVSFVALSICVMTIPKLRENADVIMISFLMILGHIMFPDWFFQAMERMKYITILNIISKTFFTIAIFLFIKEREDYILQPLFTSLGFVVSGIIAMYYILVKWNIRLYFTSFKVIIKTIKSSMDVFISNMMPNLWNSFSTVLLGFFSGNVANGIYDVGNRFFHVAYNVMGNLSRIFYPYLSRNNSKHYLYAKISLSISIVMSILLCISAPLIIELFFTDEFNESVDVLRILSFVLIGCSLSSIWGVNYLLINGFDRQYRSITILVSLLAMGLAVPLISKFSFIGKSVLMLVSNMSLGILYWIYARKNKHDETNRKTNN